MSSYPAPTDTSITVFNPKNYEVTYDADTIDYADSRYFKLSGGTVSGDTTFSSDVTIGSKLLTGNAYQIGSSTALNSGSSAISASTTVGCYTVTSSWSTSNSATYTISSSSFLINSANTNAMGSFKVYVSSKVSGGTKLGIISFDYLTQSGSTAVIPTSLATKSSNLTTLTVTITNTKDILITGESDCRYCWRADFCI